MKDRRHRVVIGTRVDMPLSPVTVQESPIGRGGQTLDISSESSLKPSSSRELYDVDGYCSPRKVC